VVSDTRWEIPAPGGFLGSYTKDDSYWLEEKYWSSLMNRVVVVMTVNRAQGDNRDHYAK
jgi:hypothetical protein